MRSRIAYGLLCGVLAGALALLVTTVTIAGAGNPWWDDRLDGQYLAGFDGQVYYDLDILEAPISIPEPTRWYLGWVVGDGETLSFYDNHDNAYTGEWHAETGCYLDWNEEFPAPIVALCYDGNLGVDMFWGTLAWDGHQGVLTGPWLYHVYITTDPEEQMRAHLEQRHRQ